MATATLDLAAEMGLTAFEYDLILEKLGRTPNLTELGMFAVMWSEHCGYKFSRPVLAYFSQYKKAMESGGHENAGVIPIGNGLGIAFKVESHNHPSAVEPYQGAATGVGGILRDIFTMGARPIACLNSLRFGPLEAGKDTPPEVAQRNRYLFEHVVAGIAGYGNCVGVPTVAGEVSFHPRYSGNPLVNAMALGILKLDEITTAGAGGIGNPVIYMGSATGKDGIHGATFASVELDEDSEDKRPNVQIGDPFAEKLLIEATLEALQTGAVHSIQDMGAAGLTCSTIEMSAKGGVGMEIDLDKVPMRESDMTAYELMLSESQERMLCVAHKGREQEVIDVFHKWGIHAEVIGHVTDSGRVRVYRHGVLEADLAPGALADECPVYSMEIAEPDYAVRARNFDLSTVPVANSNDALLKLLGSPNIASKRWVFQQFDQQVQTQTALLPGNGDAAVIAPRGTNKGIAMKIDGNSLWTYLDPYVGGQLAVCESARNVACVGAMPAGMTDGLNFGSPQQPHVFWQFERSVKAIADTAEALQTPVVSGNVSFYNQSELGEVLPSPMVGMIGIIEKAENRIGSVPSQGDELLLIWTPGCELRQEGLGASSYLQVVHAIEDGVPSIPHIPGERAIHRFLVEGAAQNMLTAAHDLSEGGLAVAIAEMCIGAQLGCNIRSLGAYANHFTREDATYFGEYQGAVLVTAKPQNSEHLLNKAKANELNIQKIGIIHGETLVVKHGEFLEINLQISQLIEVFESTISKKLSQ
jgi:phosphoribosylformylglycinamidine synthase